MYNVLDAYTTRNAAIAAVRAEANYLIEQAERKAQGWDKGMFRDDDATRCMTIRQREAISVFVSFALSAKFAN